MNVNSAPKYSLESLEGDEWEVRRTKQILRAVVREKEARRVTTEVLAARCSAFLGAPESVKKATLNGLFAGKRKTISITELAMLAHALATPVWDLIYPAREKIEVRPGVLMSAADALVADSFISLPVAGTGNMIHIPGRLVDTSRLITRSEVLTDHVARAIAHKRVGIGLGHHLASAAYEAFEFRLNLAKYEELYGEAPTLRSGVREVASLTFNRNEVAQGGDASDHFAAQLLAIEHLFAGISIGDYELGSANGELHEEG